MADFPLEKFRRRKIQNLLEEERGIAADIERRMEASSGVLDIERSLKLISLRLDIVLEALECLQEEPDQNMKRLAEEKALEAVSSWKTLSRLNVSEDQKEFLEEFSLTSRIKEKLRLLLLKGGGELFSRQEEGKKQLRRVNRAVLGALKKFARPDDAYQPLFRTEDTSPGIRRFLKLFFPTLAPEGQAEPPYGIPEGEEVLYVSEKIKVPLSQAVFYYEQELLPALLEQLRTHPGDREIQKRIREVRELLDEYRSYHFTPRSTPIVLEKDFYTEWISGYNRRGELMVTLDLPVIYFSGNNFDRIQEEVQIEVVRRLAGKGVFPELDREYRYLGRIESGLKGSSRMPGSRLNGVYWFDTLKNRVKSLRYLAEREQFVKLINLINLGRSGEVERLLTASTSEDDQDQILELE